MRILGIFAVMVLGLTLSFGQSSTQPASGSNGSDTGSSTLNRNDSGNHDNSNWGWLGLLGLAGLGGLSGRNRENTTSNRRSVQEMNRAA